MLSTAACKRIDKWLYSDSVFYKYKDLDSRSCFIIALQHRRGIVTYFKMGEETELYTYANVDPRMFVEAAFFNLFEREDLDWRVQNWDRL